MLLPCGHKATTKVYQIFAKVEQTNPAQTEATSCRSPKQHFQRHPAQERDGTATRHKRTTREHTPQHGRPVWVFGGSLKLSVALCGALRIIVALCGSVWLCMDPCGSLCLSVALCGFLWLSGAVRGSRWLWVSVAVWLFVVLCGSVLLFVALRDSLWLSVDGCDLEWLSVALCASLGLSIALCSLWFSGSFWLCGWCSG